MRSNYDFYLTPAYCLYNGAAVLEQEGASISFLVENIKDKVLCGRLTRAFENHVVNIRKLKECPEDFQRLINIRFEEGSRARLRKCVSKLYLAGLEVNKENQNEKSESQEQKEAAAVLLLDSILNEARLRQATDIHIEKNCVRLRVNGRLEKLLELQKEKSLELVQRIKVLSGMNVIENRRCQDGQFVYGNKNPFFLRVSTMAVLGEKGIGEESIVMRLLDTSRLPLAIGQLGFNESQLEKLCGDKGLISLSNGLVLICGPTGSGKSTTSAALLVEIEKRNCGKLKIISLEDPPEYRISGVTQVKVDEKNTFLEALNHIFRQDPDVIMIGEIRDEESAAAALRASLTGHLVFATLHSGSASEALLRLENLGLERGILCQVLRGVICQELSFTGGAMKLIAEVAVPKSNFSEKAVNTVSAEEVENLMEHYTNYREVMNDTLDALISGNHKNPEKSKRTRSKKPLVPLYKKGGQNAGIYKGVV